MIIPGCARFVRSIDNPSQLIPAGTAIVIGFAGPFEKSAVLSYVSSAVFRIASGRLQTSIELQSWTRTEGLGLLIYLKIMPYRITCRQSWLGRFPAYQPS